MTQQIWETIVWYLSTYLISFIFIFFQNRELLNNVMKELQGHDPVKAMLGHIEVIVDPNKDIEDKEFALEELETYCEDLDLARGEEGWF